MSGVLPFCSWPARLPEYRTISHTTGAIAPNTSARIIAHLSVVLYALWIVIIAIVLDVFGAPFHARAQERGELSMSVRGQTAPHWRMFASWPCAPPNGKDTRAPTVRSAEGDYEVFAELTGFEPHSPSPRARNAPDLTGTGERAQSSSARARRREPGPPSGNRIARGTRALGAGQLWEIQDQFRGPQARDGNCPRASAVEICRPKSVDVPCMKIRRFSCQILPGERLSIWLGR